MSVLGIDVSHFQGTVNWHAVAGSGVRFAFAKATDGSSFVDPMFGTNWPAMREAGVLRGAYHFGHPGSDPEIQAAHFASVVGPLSWGELPPVLDLEVDDTQSNDAIVSWTLAFVAKAEALFGCPLIMYTGGLWRRLGSPDVGKLSSRLLWTARYSADPPGVLQPWADWTFWQFTDGRTGDAKQIQGISGPCDCDWYKGEIADLQALSDGLAKGGGPTPTPTPTPTLSGTDGNDWPGRIFVWPSAPAVTGADVSAWQARIAKRGFAVTADGIYGPESKAACLAFQRQAGLNPDGIVGRATWKATFDDQVS